MTYATLSDLRQAITRPKGPKDNPVWAAKMLHFVPDLPTVKDRKAYLAEKATGQVVLDLGSSGPISQAVKAAATSYFGVDKAFTPLWAPQGATVDLDREPSRLPHFEGVTAIFLTELLEHLANPGRLLDVVRATYPDRTLWITVPCASAYQVMDGTHEVVNGEHVAWYSYTTLSTLLRRSGYTIQLARWYNGDPHKSEGLIVMARDVTP